MVNFQPHYTIISVDLKNLPLIQSYDSIQALTKNINKSDRDHDLVIAVSIYSSQFLLSFGQDFIFCFNIALDINTFYWYIFSLIVWQSGIYGLAAKKFLCLLCSPMCLERYHR